MPEHNDEAPIRQVYVWLLTKDEQVVIVSKDGKKWQLPGGKPNEGETALETACRETLEETGVDISPYQNDLHFFGEYTIQEPDTIIHPPVYRQVRSWLQIPVNGDELKLSIAREADGQRPEDAVRFVRTVPVRDILQYIPWMQQTDEYKTLKRNKVIPREELPT